MSPNFPNYEDFAAGRERLAVVGLGYVGLPLAVALARHFEVTGFDRSAARIEELRAGRDRTGEVAAADLAACRAHFSADANDLARARLIIVAVPTPIDSHRSPELAPLRAASATVGAQLARGSMVVYESTVYPGVSEEICAPILEQASKLRLGRDFRLGYSPERINPGDRVHTLENIVKVVSASDQAGLELLSRVYGAVVRAGVHRAPSIRVAEAAKVIENTQRDLNIALMNELSLIFDRLGIDTLEVLKAAGSKWNFLPFRPGLVGGHCIGVDPYYLTFKAEEAGYQPRVILAGRRINDGMGQYVGEKTIKLLARAGQGPGRARIGLFGLTFKENVPDLRNSRVPDIKAELEEYGANVLVHDPLADPDEARREYGIDLLPLEAMTGLDAAVFAVAHDAYAALGPDFPTGLFARPGSGLLVDLKGLYEREAAQKAGLSYWRL